MFKLKHSTGKNVGVARASCFCNYEIKFQLHKCVFPGSGFVRWFQLYIEGSFMCFNHILFIFCNLRLMNCELYFFLEQ